jgi:L-rhamnose-H+ transport protein
LLAQHRRDLWQNLPVLVVVLWGGFVTNFLWSVVLILRNRSAKQFLGAPGRNPMRGSAVTGVTLAEFDSSNLSASLHIATPVLIANYGFAVLAGVFWYFQFFFYSMGQVKMGRYDFSSWTLHMASIIIFAGLWGLALKEWSGTSRNARALMALGLMLLVASTLVVGYGNYLQMSQGRGTITQN